MKKSMNHIAILKKSWKFSEKIRNGGKTIESRWYAARRAPWDRVREGDIIYFKDSGEPVRMRARVRKVLQFDNLTPLRVRKILEKYGARIGIAKKEMQGFLRRVKDKKYCILVFLENPETISPFDINKRGFGLMAAWLAVGNGKNLKQISSRR